MFTTVSVESTALEKIAYDDKTQRLHIQFDKSTGKYWEYEAIPKSLWVAFPIGPHVGKWFNANVRKKYKGKKIPGTMFAKD